MQILFRAYIGIVLGSSVLCLCAFAFYYIKAQLDPYDTKVFERKDLSKKYLTYTFLILIFGIILPGIGWLLYVPTYYLFTGNLPN